MNSALQRPCHACHGGPRTCFGWFLIVTLMLYILYSSHRLLRDDHQDCPIPLDASTQNRLQKPVSLTNSSNPSVQLKVQEKEEAEKEKEKEKDKDKEREKEEEKEKENTELALPSSSQIFDTEIKHIVFGIAASSKLWEKRKRYIKQWWRPRVTRGVVWLDKPVRTRRNEGLPLLRISSETSQFKYTNRQGDRSALRISRIVSETLMLGLKDVRWFVMGDDDTVFVVDNVVRVLSKYDHRQLYYIGSSSESHTQNIFFSYSMAYGGGGFAISYPLAVELAKIQDRCIQRYPGLYGSDDRVQACMAELGVPLTKEAGFHQVRAHTTD